VIVALLLLVLAGELGAFLAREATAVDELPATPVVSAAIAGEPPGT
jgi:hypothetical protein